MSNINKKIAVFLCVLLFSSIILPNIALAAESSVGTATEQEDLDHEVLLDEIIESEDQIEDYEELPDEIVELEDQIGDYLDQFEYTEEDFENMNDEEFEKVFDEIYNSEEFLELEETYEDEFTKFEKEQQMGMIEPQIAPILVPIAAAAARVAIQTIVKHGTKIASKYLKNKLKSVGKNYKLIWNSKNKNGKITSLLKIQHKKTKQIVFRIDNGTIPLKPGSTKWYWHYHIGGTQKKMKHHYSLRSLVPSKHKPTSQTTLY